ncbi:MAG: NADP(H)-dependent aldo-keto reductase [Klebsiella sp.]|nr:NADP(H)-dependent aldo-keto reductase [Klebsiella sp.]
MRYQKLGNTGLFVSELCLGTMTFGGEGGMWGKIGQLQQSEAEQLVGRALDAGINFIDTANVYSEGRSEEITGQALKNLKIPRENVVVATKVFGETGTAGVNSRGSSRYHIISSVKESLRRMQLDHIDLYQLHGFDPATPMEEMLYALDNLVQHGHVRYIGVSNETAFGVMRYLHLADKHDLPRIVTIQNPYSLLNRSYEVGLAEVTQYEEVELLAYSCLGFGTLTGKYLNGAKPAGARNTLFSRFTRYSGEQTQKAVAAYVDIAKRHGLDPAQMALAFVRRQPFVASTLLGATTMEQLKTNIESFHLNLSEEVLAEIEAVHQVYTYPAP